MERFTFRSYASASVFSLIPVTFVAIAVIFRRDIRYFLHQEFLPLISNVSGYFSQQVRRKQKSSHKNNTATEENSSASSPIKSDTKRRLLLLYGTSTVNFKSFKLILVMICIYNWVKSFVWVCMNIMAFVTGHSEDFCREIDEVNWCAEKAANISRINQEHVRVQLRG